MKKTLLTNALLLASVLPAAQAGSMGNYTPAHTHHHHHLTHLHLGNAYWGLSTGGSQTRFDANYMSDEDAQAFYAENILRPGKVKDSIPFVGAHIGHSWANAGVPVRLQVRYNYDFRGRDSLVPYGVNAPFPTGYVNANVKFYSQQVMVDALYDFYKGEEFSVYAGGGIGAAFNKTKNDLINSPAWGNDDVYSSEKNTNFAYNVQAGLDRMVNHHVNIGVFARYTGLGKFRVEKGIGDEHAHQFSGGIKMDYYFSA